MSDEAKINGPILADGVSYVAGMPTWSKFGRPVPNGSAGNYPWRFHEIFSSRKTWLAHAIKIQRTLVVEDQKTVCEAQEDLLGSQKRLFELESELAQ